MADTGPMREWTSLHVAVFLSRYEIVELLLSKGADIEARTGPSLLCPYWTPIHIAVRQRDPQMAKLLISRGADVNAITRKMRLTPLQMAQQMAKDETGELAKVVAILSDAGGGTNPDAATEADVTSSPIPPPR